MPGFPLILASTGGDDSTAAFFRALLVIMLAASVVSIIARRIRLPSIPGYLLVGAAIGSSALGLIDSGKSVTQISDLAIVLLMFTIGLHLDTNSIRSGMVSILGVGVVATLGVAAACWPVGMLFGLSAPVSLAIGFAISMSSTAVVLGLLNQHREVHRIHGRLCVGISLVQDMLSIGVLAVMPLLAVWAGVGAAAPTPHIGPNGLSPLLELVLTFAKRAFVICIMVVLSRWLLPKALKEASKNANTEALLVVATTAALGAAAVTYMLGLGSALGAFLAGFMLSATPFRHQLAGQLSPMRDLFMAVFFTAVGINMDVGAALHSWWVVGLAVGAVVLIKSGVIGFTTWASGATAPVSLLTGLLLAQAGEFSLVILDGAVDQGLVTINMQSVLIAIVVLTLVLTTPLYELAKSLQPRMARVPLARWITSSSLREHGPASPMKAGSNHSPHAAPEADDPPLPYPHRPVIIAGFGVVGRNLAEHFAAAGIPYTVIELNPSTVIRQQKLGRSFIFGDIANPDVLESAGVTAAAAVIITIPDDEAVLRACRTIRERAPAVFIAARTTYLSRAIAATEMGADYVCVEEVVTAQDMAKQVMERLARRLIEV